MAFYNLVLHATQAGNTIDNAFQYETGSLLPSMPEAGALSAKFIAEILPLIRAVVHATTLFQSVYVTAPYSPDVFGLATFTSPGLAGLLSGEALPRFNAWGFRQPRRRRDINDGAKRFSIVAEGSQSGGIPIAATLTALNALATKMNSVLSLTWDDGSSAMQSIIVKRIKYTTPGGKTAYRIPQGMDPYVFYVADGWQFRDMTTQNTRKTGRGA